MSTVEMAEEVFVALDPRPTRAEVPQRRLAERNASLENVVMGLVVNGLQEEMMLALGEEVARRIGARRIVKVIKHGLAVAPEAEDWKRLTSEAQVAITGYGG